MIKHLNQLKKENLDGKKVILRVNFDVAVNEGKITEDFRIRAHKQTLNYLVDNGAKVMLISHLGHDDPSKTFLPITEQIGGILGETLTLLPHAELSSVDLLFKGCQILLLDNTRQDQREVKNSDDFARELARGFDYYVNDDFATVHREHASVVAITKYLPSYVGFLIKKEIDNLQFAVDAPSIGKVLVLGGAKISTKMPVIKNFIYKAEKILIGGALANDFFLAQGINVGASVVDKDFVPDIQSEKIVLPQDALIANNKRGDIAPEATEIKNIKSDFMILDIGPDTAKYYAKIIQSAEIVIWNGPMGLSEVEAFAGGTRAVAESVSLVAKSVVGGGDTIAAVDGFGLLGKYGFVSTGGGAMLEFLAGNRLPGLAALGYYD